MKPFHIEIVTPDGLVYDGEIDSLLVRTDTGDVEILAGHTDYVASIAVGRARILKDGVKRFASVNGGFLSVKNGEVKLLTITFEFADQIDLKRAKAAKERAEASLAAVKGQNEEKLVQAKLRRALSRIKVAELK